MSLSAFAILAAVAATAVPAHSVAIDHRGSTYRIDYRAQVQTSMKTIGIAPPTRPSSQRCVMTAKVAVERVIAEGGHELTALLPSKETFTRQLPGDCRNRSPQLAKLVDDNAGRIAAHMAKTASSDRHHALAAIDAAHHIATN